MDLKTNLQNKILEKAGLAYSLARTGHFAIQGFALPWMDRLATGKKREAPKAYTEHLRDALDKITALHNKDIENIKNGIYPWSVLSPENPLQHFKRYPQVLMDSFKAAKRREQKEAHEFFDDSQDDLEKVPEYYRRNFHFQTGGYLSDVSAELYEHQVEILFSGAADPMRRLILPALKIHFNGSDGKGLKFLELGSGTGRLTRFLALAFPKAEITCVDLSPFYLKKARERLKEFKNINFVQGAAENLNFKDESFDAVVSCFLFHELPLKVRKDVFLESFRLLKPNGFLGATDSIQKGDDPNFDWALTQFPIDFHEPFYKNYIENPLETTLDESGLKVVSTEVGFLSKAVASVKP